MKNINKKTENINGKKKDLQKTVYVQSIVQCHTLCPYTETAHKYYPHSPKVNREEHTYIRSSPTNSHPRSTQYRSLNNNYHANHFKVAELPLIGPYHHRLTAQGCCHVAEEIHIIQR